MRVYDLVAIIETSIKPEEVVSNSNSESNLTICSNQDVKRMCLLPPKRRNKKAFEVQTSIVMLIKLTSKITKTMHHRARQNTSLSNVHQKTFRSRNTMNENLETLIIPWLRIIVRWRWVWVWVWVWVWLVIGVSYMVPVKTVWAVGVGVGVGLFSSGLRSLFRSHVLDDRAKSLPQAFSYLYRVHVPNHRHLLGVHVHGHRLYPFKQLKVS